MAITDEELMKRCRRGDTSALSILLARYQNQLPAFIYSVTGDYQVSEDIFQETFLRVYRKAEKFNPDRSFKTWLYAIALNLCRDRIRKLRRKPTLSLNTPVGYRDGKDYPDRIDLVASDQPDPRRLAAARELEEVFRRELAGLSAEHRQVVVMSRLSGMKYREIAEVLKIPSGTVRSRLHYALEYLRQRMQNNEMRSE